MGAMNSVSHLRSSGGRAAIFSFSLRTFPAGALAATTLPEAAAPEAAAVATAADGPVTETPFAPESGALAEFARMWSSPSIETSGGASSPADSTAPPVREPCRPAISV